MVPGLPLPLPQEARRSRVASGALARNGGHTCGGELAGLLRATACPRRGRLSSKRVWPESGGPHDHGVYRRAERPFGPISS